ncbi:MAG: LysR family transcriptional regulator, partial [Desulfatitalea sp.]|nr:LysR family transcriptional regulator [Desulfatitalea sp.]
MDLWQLKIFCKVVELQSFSKAGEAVHLSQPTVSSHIKDLETHFGTQLIDRLARQAQPTKAGELLYAHACRLMALRDEAETAMAEFLGKIKGRLTIGGSTIPGAYILPRLIGDFAKDYPGVRVALRVADTAAILAAIADGQVELGLVGATADDGQFQQAPLLGDQLCLVVPKAHRWAARQTVTIQEMLAEPFIVREKGSGTLKVVAHILQNVGYRLEDLNIVAEMGSTEAVRQGIKGGVGISILSAMAIADDVQAGVLTRLALGEVDT